jgi:hypothetical protein
MGNIVSDPIDNNLIQNTELKKIIEQWAMNDYDAGISWGKIDIHNTPIRVKNLLKKRACCTRQTNMIIALPNVDIFSSGANSIKEGYKPVKIILFEDDAFVRNPDVCRFIDQSQPNDPRTYSYYQDVLVGNAGASAKCKSLYEGGGTNLGLCNKIKTERISTYKGKPAQSAYGFYATNQQVIKDNSLDLYNNYTDCNCLNSILRDINVPQVLGFSNLNSLEQLVQSNDAYCTKCSSAGICYISSAQRVNSLCINISEIQNTLVENNSNLQNIQNCSMDNTIGDTSYVDPSIANDWVSQYITTSPVSEQQAQGGLINPDQTIVQSNTNTIIIAISILIGIIIIAVILVKVYKPKKQGEIQINQYSRPSPNLYNTRSTEKNPFAV